MPITKSDGQKPAELILVLYLFAVTSSRSSSDVVSLTPAGAEDPIALSETKTTASVSLLEAQVQPLSTTVSAQSRQSPVEAFLGNVSDPEELSRGYGLAYFAWGDNITHCVQSEGFD